MGMPIAVLVPIYAGWATPTESAAIAVAYSLILAVVYRGIGRKMLAESFLTTAKVTAALFMIIGAAFLLNQTLTYIRVPFQVSEGLSGLGLSLVPFLGMLLILYLLMGCFLDSSAILLISVPILLPTIAAYHVDFIQYAIIVVVAIEAAAITPPYGINLFVATGILSEPFHDVVVGATMFFPALLLGLILVTYLPSISLFLPNLLR